MSDPAPPAFSRDEELLRLLYIFHYVLAGVYWILALIPSIHLLIGYMMVFNNVRFDGTEGTEETRFVGWMFMISAAAVITLGLLLAALTALSGRCIERRKRRTFSLVISGLNCLAVPFGTVLGVFTIIVLERPGVRALYSPQR